MPPHFVYAPEYFCDIGDHVFPTTKFRLVYEALTADQALPPAQFAPPLPLTREQILLVHSPEYVDDLLACRWTPRTLRSELPISPEIVNAFRIGCGGTLVAARLAFSRRSAAMNLGGGFHHAFPDSAEGFCYINDVALAVEALRRAGHIRRAAVLDCDLHQGNGTAFVFRNTPDVFTFSIHQENNYPVKQTSDLDIGLADGTGDETYLRHLREAVPRILDSHRPEFVLYVAGADPFCEDQLGGLALTRAGLAERDRLVLDECAQRRIPLAATLAGGYARRLEDTVAIHVGTARLLLEAAARYETNE
jgi:acetoin utilization deacetylase AcuC-like enzyme